MSLGSRNTFNPVTLWEFSCKHYEIEGAADVYVELQDAFGVNVNLLLWCAWLDSQQITLTQEQLDYAMSHIESWDRDYVMPLRQLRRQMKNEFSVSNNAVEAVRQQIKQAELAAEYYLQSQLALLADNWTLRPDPERLNLLSNQQSYLCLMQVPQHHMAYKSVQNLSK